jgi:ATP-dependent DNA ligase
MGDVDHEGVVAKRMEAPYRAGARSTWRKIKYPRYSRQQA